MAKDFNPDFSFESGVRAEPTSRSWSLAGWWRHFLPPVFAILEASHTYGSGGGPTANSLSQGLRSKLS